MRVVPVHGEIPFVADRMFPVPSLPDPALAARVMTGDLRSPFGKGIQRGALWSRAANTRNGNADFRIYEPRRILAASRSGSDCLLGRWGKRDPKTRRNHAGSTP